jgi:DNA-binding NtrC family response regulator
LAGLPAGATARAALIVDDDTDMCWTLALALARAGFGATSAGSAEQALALAARAAFAIAFVDARLPDMDGIQLIGELRRLLPALKTILISGYYFEDDPRVSAALAAACIEGFLAKPFRLDAVTAALALATGGKPCPAMTGETPRPPWPMGGSGGRARGAGR